jgi:hypothetical protein
VQEATSVATGDAFKAGDIAASSFAGTKLISDGLQPGVDPLSKTFIDPNGITLRVYSMPNRGAPNTPLNPPAVLQVEARDIGHVFAVVFDNLAANGAATPGLFAAATSAFGLQIVGPDHDGDGKPDRLTKGGAGATFMEGQFGSLPGAGPGTIYKVDRASGNASVFANVSSGSAANAGPGIGGLAFDPASRTLFASDLDTGLIHAFASDGSDVAQFDHGVNGRPVGTKTAVPDDGKRMDIASASFDPANPATWGFTQPERRIDALAVHDGRLYYAVADGPQIWSVGIDTGGKFSADPRLETTVQAARPFPVTGIAFDHDGRMIVTQRGTLQSPADYSHFTENGPTQTFRFTAESPDDPSTPGLWKAQPEEYAVGNGPESRSSSGGLTLQYAYKDDGSIDTASCGGSIIVSGDDLGAKADDHGLQLNAIGLVRPANLPPTQSAIITLPVGADDATARGYAGGVAARQDCGGGGGEGGFPPVAGGDGAGMPPIAGSGGAPGDQSNFPPVEDQAGGGTTTDDGAAGGKTTNGPLELTKVPGSATCAENQSCSFTVTVKNTSNQPVDSVSFSDNPTIGGVPFTKFKLGDVAAPWTCTAAAAPGMQCTHPTLQPNESADLTLSFTPDAGSLGAATEFKNCASFADANGPAADNPQQAALPPPPAPTNSNNGGLKVETIGTTPTCSPATGNCEFEVKITNNTGQPITDQPLKIFDTLSVGTQTQAKNNATSMQLPPGLQCQPNGREFNCSQDKLTLAPNQSVSLKVSFSVDTTEGGQANFVQNKTNVTLGPLTGEATGAIGILDDKKLPEPGADGQQAGGAGGQANTPACATIPITPPGPIVVNKKGPTKCAPKGECAFTIDVTNNSATPIQGPIEIQDTIDLPNTTISGAVAAPFACDPGGPPFKCRLNGPLAANETKTLALTLKFDAPADVKSVKNCAIPTQPPGAAGGGAGQNQGQQLQPLKQLAPGKKSEILPFDRNPLLHFASFKPQSFASPTRFLHFVGDPGGNIGGVPDNKCLKWGMPNGGFNVTQSNGPHVGFGNLKVGPDGTTTGEASFISNDGPVTGTVTGTIIGAHVDLTVHWKNNNVKSGHYTGDVGPDGNFSGTNKASNGATATFKSEKPWFKCALDDLCKKYADDAIAAETEFASLHCGTVGSGRWSDKIDDHITWCMAQTRAAGSPIQSETDERAKELNSCREFDARCTKTGLAMAAANDEMKALKCADAIPSLQPDKAKSLCKISAIKVSPEALAQSVQQRLTACKALLAKAPVNPGGADPGGAVDPGGAGGAGDPGGAGGAGGQGNGAQAPAANQCVTVELDPNTPAPVTGLALSKNPTAGKCTAGGGGCDFVVTVFNPDQAAEFNGPVSFTDHISAPDGSVFPNVTVQTPINPQADPGITGGTLACQKNGNDINCTSGGASLKIPAGKKITIPMSFTPGNGSVAKAVKNCASLPGADQQCATIPFADNGPLLRAKKLTVGDLKTCVPSCEFAFSLSNVGTSDAQGPFVLKDVFTAANGFDSFEMIGDSKFACTNTNGTIGCISTNGGTNKLPPGQTINGFIVFKTATVSPEYKNCIQYDPAAQAKPSPFDQDSGPLCATIKDTVHAGPNLLMQLTAPNEGPDGTGKCAINSPCRFSTLVRSNGAVDFPERARFSATVTPNVPQSLRSGDGRWICGPEGKALCSDGLQQTTLAVGNQLPGEIEIVAGPGWQKNSILTLCTKIAPANLKSDTNPADDQACKSVVLDPFNVKVSKTGDQTCAPGGECHFTLNLFNPGPIDHNAPVTITDHLKGLSSAQILSIKPPLPCASQPTQIPFSCTSPDNVCLDLNGKAGEKCGPQTFDMVVRLPNDASAQQFANCASVTDGEKQRSDDESCHSVSLKPAEQTPPPPSQPGRVTPPQPPPPPVVECVRGMVLINGLCQCPPGTRFNGRRCWSDTGTGGAYPAMPGTEIPPPPLPRYVPCPRSRPIGSYPNCCPVGTEYRFGACRPPHREPPPPPPPIRVCPPERPNGTFPHCCPRSMDYKFGACRPLRETPPPPPIRVCPPDRPNGTFPTCCPRGMDFKFGACRPSRETPPPPPIRVCPPDRPEGVFPQCCPRGMEFKYGACRRPGRPTDTHGPGTGGADGNTGTQDNKCPPNYHKLPRPGQRGGGTCVPNHVEPLKCPADRPVGTPPNCCPQGMTYRMGRCYADRCGPGLIGRPPRCRQPNTNPPNRPPPTPQQQTCSKGKILSRSGQCVCPAGQSENGEGFCTNAVR